MSRTGRSRIFRDDELLQTLVEHFDPSPETLVRIIHSRLTSMSVIHMIINRGLHLDNAGVVLEFYNNPKVTNDALVKLQGRLSESMIFHVVCMKSERVGHLIVHLSLY